MALGHAVAYPVDSRLLEIARHKFAIHAKHCGIALRQSFAKAGQALKKKADGSTPSSLNANRCEGTFTILSPHFTLLAGTHSAFRGETNQPMVFWST